jgi:predicted dehydrogenase/threonine dehydrogenase-like Zn-dependent dehydrogenase
MRQVLQYAHHGEIEVAEVPTPKLLPGCALVRIAASLVSAGTERAAAEFAGKNLFQKAGARPDLVREVFNKVRRDGFFSAVQAVRTRLDQPLAVGYSSAGTVVAIHESVTGIKVGDRVACAGAGYATHAEIGCIPRLLMAHIPNGSDVSFEEAAFSTIGAVAMHGVRTAEAKLGEVVGVIGLGLLGQLTIQILKAAGCRVVGMDIVSDRTALAEKLCADRVTADPTQFAQLCLDQSHGRGADTILITAETPSSDPVNLAADAARDRGIIVAVGTVGMNIRRKLYYEKELDFRVSRSYGPGRYDAAYEQKGRDYPIGYARWTENRNMEAFLELLADGKVDVKPLITHRVPIERASDAYEIISGITNELFLGVLITYRESARQHTRLEVVSRRKRIDGASGQSVRLGVLGAGSFAMNTLLPAMKKVSGKDFIGICAASGSHARHAAEKFSFRYCATDEAEIINDPALNTIVIATRHHLHASQVLAALQAGKHVFCEKPLCLKEDELAEIIEAYHRSQRHLMVGFNRRFAPMVREMKLFVENIHEPLAMHYRINAGPLAHDHWINDPEQGGGRILGEVCHFIDLLSFLSGTPPIEVHTRALAANDQAILSLKFANGSQGTITYLANGDRSYSKERLEIFGGGAVAVLDDFRRLELARNGRKRIIRSWLRQDKGHRAEWEAFSCAIRSGSESPIPFSEIVANTLATLRAVESRSSGQPAHVDLPDFLNSQLRQVPSC